MGVVVKLKGRGKDPKTTYRDDKKRVKLVDKGRRKRQRKTTRAKELNDQHLILPLDYALKILRDPDEKISDERRDRLAIAAMPYLHPKVVSVHHHIMRAEDFVASLTLEQLRELRAFVERIPQPDGVSDARRDRAGVPATITTTDYRREP